MNEVRDWRPRAGVDIARLRAGMLDAARDYFRKNSVLEIDAPTISTAAVSDPNIDSMTLHSVLDGGRARYLHSSPEYAMKRLLAAGYPDIGFIGTVYRDGEAGRRHQPEFTMVEWYRLGLGLEAMIDETEIFLARLLADSLARPDAFRLSYSDAFRRYLDVDPLSANAASLAELAGADADLETALGEDRDAWLDLLMATEVATKFPGDRMTTVYHYPSSQAALARLADSNRQVAERFEVFLGDAELANGYVELTDAEEQRRRFERDQNRRRNLGRPVYPLDERLLAALESGLPACAGVAVGFDRLLMLRAGVDDIRDARPFSWENS